MAGRKKTAIIFSILAAIFVALSFRASFVPSEFLFLFFFASLVLAPGFLLARIFAPNSKGAIFASAVFALGAAFVMAVLTVLSLFEADITLLRIIAPISLVALALYPQKGLEKDASRESDCSRAVRDRTAASILIVLIAATCAFVWITGDPLLYTSDSADHIAYLRTIARTHESFPEKFYYPDGGSLTRDIRKGMAHVLWGALAAMSDEENMEFIWKTISIIGTAFFLVAIYSGSVLIFESPWIGLVAVLLTVFVYDGGLAKNSFAQIGGGYLFGKIFYVTAISSALLWLEKGKRMYLILAVAAALAASFTHIAHFAIFLFSLAIFALCALIGLCALSSRRESLLRTLKVLAWTIIVAAPYLALRYLRDYAPSNIIHTHLQGALFFGEKFFSMNPVVFADAAGKLGLVALLSLVFLRRERKINPPYCLLANTLLAVYIMLFVPIWFPTLLEKFSYLLIRFEFAAPSMLISGFFVVRLICALMKKSSAGDKTLSRGAALLGLAIVAAITVPALVKSPAKIAVASRNPEPIEGISFRELADLFSYMRRNIPAGSTVASDPVTSYGIPAFSDNYALVPLDQHSTPNDSTAAKRIADARRILSLWASPKDIAEYLESHGARFLILNGRIGKDVGTMYYKPSRSTINSVASSLRDCPAFVERYASNSVYLFEYDPERIDKCDTALREPYFLGSAIEQETIGSLLDSKVPCIRIEKVNFTKHRIARGDTVTANIVWVAVDSCPFSSYVAHLRFDMDFPRKALFNPAWGKPYRKIIEKIFHERYRFRVDFQPLEGLFPPDEWPVMKRINDSVTFVVPRDVAPGIYTVFLRIAEKPQYPNYVLSDLLTDDDFYRGPEVGSLEIE